MSIRESAHDEVRNNGDLPPFAVTSLTVENFRGFASLDSARWGRFNVIVGINGSGKTAILDAITVALAQFILPPGLSGELLGKGNLRSGSNRLRVQLSIQGENLTATEKLEALPDGNKLEPKPRESTELDHIGLAVRMAAVSPPIRTVPIIQAYGVDRAAGEVGLAPAEDASPEHQGAFDLALSAKTKFAPFFRWFRDREDLENERRARRSDDYRDSQLSAVRDAIESFMEGYSGLRVERSPLRLAIDKGGETLDVQLLSDGEKTFLALIGDIARRLAIANPSSELPLNGAGIVMIDEVDLHLHPTWQRKVVKSLPKVFPNVQFFLTTHSPVVAASSPPGSLFLLDDWKLIPQEQFGQEVGLVLDELFKTPDRDIDVQEQIDSLFEAIGERAGDLAHARIKALEAILGPKDPLLTKAKTRMRGLGLD